jgi:hypothetical protein
MAWASRSSSRSDKLADGAAFACLLAIAVLSTKYSLPLIDDVHITLRHSLNFARGDGLVYNPGERLLGARALAFFVGLGSARACFARSKTSFVRARATATAALGIGSLIVVGHGSDLRLFRPLGPPDPTMAYVKIGKYLKANVPRDASVGAMEIGIIGYYSGSKIVDFAGLVSPGVMPAVASGRRRYVLDTFHPDYVVARYPIPQALEGGLTESELVADYEFLFGARGVGVFEAPCDRPGAGSGTCRTTRIG